MNSLIICISLFFLNLVSSIEFEYSVYPKSLDCFGDVQTQNTLVIGEVKSTSFYFRVNVYDPNGRILLSRSNETAIKYSFTTQIPGTYQICIENLARDFLTISFSLNSGVFAKDYSELAQKKNLKPMETVLKKIDDLTKELQKNGRYMSEKKEEKINGLESIITKIITYSIICIAVMISLSIFQSTYLKRFFKAKKLI